MSEITKVGIVGGGTMGAGIAEVAAKAGADVIVYDINDDLVTAGKNRIEKSLATAVSKGKLEENAQKAALKNLKYTTDLKDLSDRQIVMEAVIENEAIKAKIFAELDELIKDPKAILATNTSSIPITRIAKSTKNPGRVVGLHFFNPVPVLKLVELIISPLTSEDTVERAKEFATKVLGKQVVKAQDRSGFIVNFLLVPYILSAIRMYESGFATKEDIDTGMQLGAAHPMGPLHLADLVGLDVCKFVADSMFEEYKEPLYAAPPLLLRMVEAGQLGKKTGKGFYDYN